MFAFNFFRVTSMHLANQLFLTIVDSYISWKVRQSIMMLYYKKCVYIMTIYSVSYDNIDQLIISPAQIWCFDTKYVMFKGNIEVLIHSSPLLVMVRTKCINKPHVNFCTIRLTSFQWPCWSKAVLWIGWNLILAVNFKCYFVGKFEFSTKHNYEFMPW